MNRAPGSIRLHLLVALTLVCSVAPAAEGQYKKTADGIIVTPAQGTAKRVRLQVMSDRIRWITPGEKQAADFGVAPDTSVQYNGQPLSIAVTQ